MIVKDWITEAAYEIGDESVGRDWIRDIIIKHCPMKSDVVYMPVPRCYSCVYWSRFELETVGVCNMVRIPTAPASADTMETREDFGCVQWKVKNHDKMVL